MTLEKIVPNLIVDDVARSLAFYRDVLGFQAVTSVPDKPPYVFVWLQLDGGELFLNAAEEVGKETPRFGKPGGSGMYFTVSGIDELYESVRGRAELVMPLTMQFYGMREFSIADPDSYLLTFAQREPSRSD